MLAMSGMHSLTSSMQSLYMLFITNSMVSDGVVSTVRKSVR